MFSSFIYMYIVYYLRITSKMDLKLYDMNNTSASDFSIQCEIPEALWDTHQRRKLEFKMDANNKGKKFPSFKDRFKEFIVEMV